MSNDVSVLIEIYSEPIPASFVVDARSRWRDAVRKQLEKLGKLGKLSNENLSTLLSVEGVRCYGTGRRLTVIIKGLPQKTESYRQEIKGPPVSAPDQAIDGFCRKHGVERSALDTSGQWVRLHREIAARPIGRMVVKAVLDLLPSFWWPVKMRMGSTSFRWVRPIRWITVRVDGQPLSGMARMSDWHLELTDQESNLVSLPDFEMLNREQIPIVGHTMGHHQLSWKPLYPKADDYVSLLRDHHVWVCADERESNVRKQLARESLDVQNLWQYLDTNELSVPESPRVLSCRIPKTNLPSFIRDSVLRDHLKVKSDDDERFFVSLDDAIHGPEHPQQLARREAARKGFERVLQARFHDAEFSWHRDRALPLDVLQERLRHMRFHRRLFALDQRVRLSADVAYQHASGKPLGWPTDVPWTVETITPWFQWLKLDLVTDTVREFPSLQGTVGAEFASAHGQSRFLIEAITGQYHYDSWLSPAKTIHNKSPPNSGTMTHHVLIVDWLTVLVCLWVAGEKPTGSGDPFALRRIGNLIVNLLLREGIDLDIGELVVLTLRSLKAMTLSDPTLVIDEQFQKMHILSFLKDRLKASVRTDDQEEKAFMVSLGTRNPWILNPGVVPESVRIVSEQLFQYTASSPINGETSHPVIEALSRVRNLLDQVQELPGDASAVADDSYSNNISEAHKRIRAYYGGFPKTSDGLLSVGCPSCFDDEGMTYYEQRVMGLFARHEDIARLFDEEMILDPHDQARRDYNLQTLRWIQADANALLGTTNLSFFLRKPAA